MRRWIMPKMFFLFVVPFVCISLVLGIYAFRKVTLAPPENLKDIGWVYRAIGEQPVAYGLVIATVLTLCSIYFGFMENKRYHMVQVQLSMYERWQKARIKIEELEGEPHTPKAEIYFRRYFELLHQEFQMGNYIHPKVRRDWNDYLEADRSSTTKYANQRISEWARWWVDQTPTREEEFKSWFRATAL